MFKWIDPERSLSPRGVHGIVAILIALVLATALPVASALAAPASGSSGTATGAIDPPAVTASAVFSFDATSGMVLYEEAADERMPVGSLAKIATALTVVKHGDVADEVTITDDDTVDITVYSNMQLVAGDTLTVGTLLYGLLIPSGNDGADALARHVGSQLSGSNDPDEATRAFVRAMNDEARALGLENTQFSNPSGIDGGEAYSTARDIAILFRELMRNERLAGIVAEPAYSFTSVGASPRQYQSETTNQLLGQQGVIGGKTGSTGDAGGCVVLAREVNDGSNQVITAILGSDLSYNGQQIGDDLRWTDAEAMFADMDQRFSWTTPGADGTLPGLAEELAVWQMEFVDPPRIPFPADGGGDASYQLVLGAPVEPGEQGGDVRLFFDDIEVGRIPVYQAG